MNGTTTESITASATAGNRGAARSVGMVCYVAKRAAVSVSALSGSLARLRDEMRRNAPHMAEGGTVTLWADELDLAARVLSDEREELVGVLGEVAR